MRRIILAAMAAGMIAGMQAPPAQAAGLFEVVGVDGNDMLKLRAGPGTGYRVIVGSARDTAWNFNRHTLLGVAARPGHSIASRAAPRR